MDATKLTDKFNRGQSVVINNEIKGIDFCDDYDHLNVNIEYVPENVLQSVHTDSMSFLRLQEQFNTCLLLSCSCELLAVPYELCDQHTAQCLHGGNYKSSYNSSSMDSLELVLNPARPIKDLIYECSDQCSCTPNCNNRLVQFGPRKWLQMVDLTHLNKGVGLITQKCIPAGGFICEYAGEILTKEEASRRHARNDSNNLCNYIICLNERCSQGDSGSMQTFIDPSEKGNIGRYLNHSCDPNCEIFSVRIDGPLPKLGILFTCFFLLQINIV